MPQRARSPPPQEGIRRFPTFEKFYLMLGQLEQRAGNVEGARTAYRWGHGSVWVTGFVEERICTVPPFPTSTVRGKRGGYTDGISVGARTRVDGSPASCSSQHMASAQ